ncbi:MAG: hypothetical protein IJX87_05870 [Clostridia bacterium]|nr:hypothetical protein [Clostridia bacterium]
MKTFYTLKSKSKSSIAHPFTLFQKLLTLLCAALLLFGFSACNKKIDYLNYVSELRGNVFLAETDEFFLRVYAVDKETPYVTDGIPKERTMRTEIYLAAPSGDKTCNLTFSVDGKTYGGEMSYDNVRAEYYYSCTLDVTALRELPCTIEYGEKTSTLNARSVLTEQTWTPQAILSKLQTEERDLFTSLTDKYGFAGEIYIRLIYEDSPYYYVGIIDRNGQVTAFLINAQTGKTLAKRQS